MFDDAVVSVLFVIVSFNGYFSILEGKSFSFHRLKLIATIACGKEQLEIERPSAVQEIGGNQIRSIRILLLFYAIEFY